MLSVFPIAVIKHDGQGNYGSKNLFGAMALKEYWPITLREG